MGTGSERFGYPKEMGETAAQCLIDNGYLAEHPTNADRYICPAGMMTDESIVDEMAAAMACNEGRHRWAKGSPGVLYQMLECAACGFRPGADDDGRLSEQTVREHLAGLKEVADIVDEVKQLRARRASESLGADE